MLSVAVTCTSAVHPAEAGDAPLPVDWYISNSIDSLSSGRFQSFRALYSVEPVAGMLSCIRQTRKEMNEIRKKKPPSVELKGPSTTHRIKQMMGTFLLEILVLGLVFSII